MNNVRCVACGRLSGVAWFTKKVDTEDYPIARCASCQSAFVWPRPDAARIEAYYRDRSYSHLTPDEVKEKDSHYYPGSQTDAARIVQRCRKLTARNDFLDVGAGNGAFSWAAANVGFRVAACEPNPNARLVFASLNGFEPDDCMFDEEYARAHAGQFDVVLLSQVLEHTLEPEALVGFISKVLRPQGIAVIAVPHFKSAVSRFQGRNDMYISPPDHLNFFTRQGLVDLLARHDMRLVHMATVSKVNRGRISHCLRLPLLSGAVWFTLYGVLRIFDLMGMGMVINAYFRKDDAGERQGI